jgi:hypothetical protein
MLKKCKNDSLNNSVMKLKSSFNIVLICVVYLVFLGQGYAQEKKVNLALNMKVEASSEMPEYPASNIVDGKITRESKWMSATHKAPHSIEINFERYCNISEIRFHSGIPKEERTAKEKNQANGFWSVKNFKIQYWDDANWTDFPKASVLENRETIVDFSFENPISTFKIRMAADDGEKISVMEIEVLGNVAKDMPAPPSLDSDVKKQVEIKEDQHLDIKVSNNVIGKTFKYVGYNQGYYLPGYNVSGWLEYANVNSLRIWTSLNLYAPKKAVQVDLTLKSVEEFDKRKADLRRNPEETNYIKWDVLEPLYKTLDYASNNTMVFDYALTESKRLGIEPILQINSRDFNESWSNKWQQWQRFYSLAYHSAKIGNAQMFAMQNEPNHRHSGPMKLEQWIAGMQIVSDAVHAAIEDVNKKYNNELTAKFIGPVTAGQNTDWWANIAKNMRIDYHGDTINHDLIDVFSTHSYNSPAVGYSTRVNNIRKILVDNHPEKKAIPIVFTEIGRWMNAYLIDKEETMDSPSLFTEWAGIYANNMKNGAFGMWAFKLVNNTSSSYPRGIKSGHHYTWQGTRFVEDAHKNLAKDAKISSSSNSSSTVFITDGNKTEASAWISNEETNEKWIEIDLESVFELGSALIYSGSAGGVFTAPDRIRNFKLEYWTGSGWEEIPGTRQENNKYAQVYLPFKKVITTSKVRFSTNELGNIKIREIKLFGKDALPSKTHNYNISGIQRTGEVVRLFAKGFKEERDLFEVNHSADDNGLDTYMSLDKKTGTYYMWLVAGTPIIGETVDAKTYGEVVILGELNTSKKITIMLQPQSVTLLSIPKGNLKKETLFAIADAYTVGGKKTNKNYGKKKELLVSLNASNFEDNKVSYISYKLPKNKESVKKVLFNITGKVDGGEKPFRCHVYAIPSKKINERLLNWDNASHLDVSEALLHDVGDLVKVVGEIAFSNIEKNHYLDVTAVILNNYAEEITFVLIRETRQLGDDEDKGRTLIIKSKESNKAPSLDFWFQK